VINDEQDKMASKAMHVSPTVSGNGSTSDGDTDYKTEISDAEPVPVDRPLSRRQSYHRRTSSADTEASADSSSLRRHSSISSRSHRSIGGTIPRPQGSISSRPRRSISSTTPRPQGSISSRRPRSISSTTPRPLSVKTQAFEGGESKEGGSGLSDRPKGGRRWSESLKSNTVSSEVTMKRRRSPNETILSANDGDNAKDNLGVESKASEGDNNTDTPSKSSDGTRKCSGSRSSRGNPSTRTKSPSVRNRRRVSEITLSAANGGDNAKDDLGVESKVSEGGNTTDSPSKSSDGTRKCSGSRSSRGNPSTSTSKSPSVRIRSRVLSSFALANIRDSLSMLDGWDDPSGDAFSSPTKSGEELRTSALSSDTAEEIRSDHRRSEVISRRQRPSRGPRERLSQSSHSRLRVSRGDRLSQSSHIKSPRIRRDRLSQSSHANLKPPALAAEDDTVDDFAENEFSSSEDNASQDNKTEDDAELAAQSTTPDQTSDARDQALLHSPERPLESHSEHTEYTSNLEGVPQSKPVQQKSPGKWTKLAASLISTPKRVTRTFKMKDGPSLTPPSATSIVRTLMVDAPSLVDSPSVSFDANSNAQKNEKSHGLHVDISKQSDPQGEETSSLDSPLVSVHPLSQMKPIPQMKPGKWKNKLADLISTPKRVTGTFTMMDGPSLTPPSAGSTFMDAPSVAPSLCAIPFLSDTNNEKTQE
jgi:hypothetical protein